MIIRKATISDIDECTAICRIKEFEMPGEVYPDAGVLIPSLNQLFFVAEDDGEIIGIILGYFLIRDMVYLDLFTVRDDHRGKKVGKQLLEKFREELKALGVSNYFLIAPTKSNKTINFYRQNGLIEGSQYTLFSESITK